VLWLLEELGCEYQLVKYQRDPHTLLAPPELRRVHPLGKSPVITDGARTIAESGAIIEYLLDTRGDGRLRPAPGSEARLRYVYWLHYAEGSAMPPLLLRPIVRSLAARVQTGFIDTQLKTHIAWWESELASYPWFAGEEFTAADIQMSFPLEAAASRAGMALGAKVRGFLERIHARSAYQRALAAGGELRLPA
jgi:glutathione S-transferase